MFYSQDVIEDVMIGNDIVDVIGKYTQLKQKGNSYFGLCPFHRENTPSFSVSADKQLYHCFGCGASGNVYSFVMQIENFDFIDAVKYLADRINYSLPEEEYDSETKKNAELKKTLYEIHKKSARHYYENLISSKGNEVRNYLENRKIGLNIRRKYGLGYSLHERNDLFNFLMSCGFDIDTILKSGLVLKDRKGNYYDRFFNRLMFPIIDVQGRIIGFGGRIIGKGEPKYLNSPDTSIFNKSHNLYSINFARNSKTKEYILVEGYMDVISLYQAGFKNVVASLGTAFNDEHAKALKRYADSVILLFDSDNAGTKAVLRAIPILKKNGIRIKVLQVTNAKDPDEYIKKYGSENFNNLLMSAKSSIAFQVEQIRKNYNLEDSAQKILFTNEVAKILSSLENSIEREVYINEVSKFTGITSNSINEEISKILNKTDLDYDLKKFNKNKYSISSTGNDDARKSVINIIVSNRIAFEAVTKVLKPSEFFKEIYVKLVEIIYDLYEKNKTIYPAELVNFFDKAEEQKEITDIFMLQFDFKDTNELEKAINDQVKKIKKAYIDEAISNITEIEELKKLVDEKRNINNLHITLSDG